MRYPRNVKIFRGGVDAAPFAGLFFVMVLFMALFYTHVFFPGVPIEFKPEQGGAELSDRTLSVKRDGSIRFLGEMHDFEGFQEALGERLKTGELPRRVILETEPGASRELIRDVEDSLQQASIGIKLPGGRLEMPEDAGFAGTPGPVIVIGINLNGQIFFQHQRIDESALQARLSEMVEKAEGPLTVVLQADSKVSYEKVIALSKVARKAGVARLVLGTRPGLS
jgi:biopolymer transport protein ExbD